MFDPRGVKGRAAFPVTDWSTIFAAAQSDESAGPARARLCKLYWFPVYAFVRRTWPAKSPDEALDVTQEFFTVRFETADIQHAHPERGRFQHWLKRTMTNLLRNDWNHGRAAKRDRRKLVELDAAPAEERFRLEPRTTIDPLRALERDLACAVLENALTRLGDEYAARDDAAFFRRARHLLVPGEAEAKYAELERCWGLNTNTLHVRVHTMRQRLRCLIEIELAERAASGDGEVDGELDWLLSAIDLADPPPESRVLAFEKKHEADAQGSAEVKPCPKHPGTPSKTC